MRCKQHVINRYANCLAIRPSPLAWLSARPWQQIYKKHRHVWWPRKWLMMIKKAGVSNDLANHLPLGIVFLPFFSPHQDIDLSKVTSNRGFSMHNSFNGSASVLPRKTKRENLPPGRPGAPNTSKSGRVKSHSSKTHLGAVERGVKATGCSGCESLVCLFGGRLVCFCCCFLFVCFVCLFSWLVVSLFVCFYLLES